MLLVLKGFGLELLFKIIATHSRTMLTKSKNQAHQVPNSNGNLPLILAH